LKTTPTDENTLRTGDPHDGQTLAGSSVNDCTSSKRWSHSVQAY
jgi:hypothetical protein